MSAREGNVITVDLYTVCFLLYTQNILCNILIIKETPETEGRRGSALGHEQREYA